MCWFTTLVDGHHRIGGHNELIRAKLMTDCNTATPDALF
ncbi:hypothetical protein A359_00420 [secondary endosymbiont of Ctenarytaina eucalypti]|uniref:Uncharacterized protein n=1 Tax=secondary endosymbiont of Ctenarytaina eucalypti TaxID=1199245 RepID=J3Z2N1_9ENTR|nr:hypothetical protein A359_00420 [secondary endosymbiont of Ctenarytaina eucalypti]